MCHRQLLPDAWQHKKCRRTTLGTATLFLYLSVLCFSRFRTNIVFLVLIFRSTFLCHAIEFFVTLLFLFGFTHIYHLEDNMHQISEKHTCKINKLNQSSFRSSCQLRRGKHMPCRFHLLIHLACTGLCHNLVRR